MERVKMDISTDRLILAPLDPEKDQENYISHLTSQNEFFIQYGLPYSDDMILEMIDMYSDHKLIYYSVFLKETLEMAGYVGLKLPSSHMPSGDLEYYIFKEYRKNGYGKEAVEVFCNSFFQGLFTGKQESEIVAETMTDNMASCKLLESVGFQLEEQGVKISLLPDPYPNRGSYQSSHYRLTAQ